MNKRSTIANLTIKDIRFCDSLDKQSQVDVVLSSDVPHGSILRPILFRLFINDLGENIFSAKYLFAVDFKLYLELEFLTL